MQIRGYGFRQFSAEPTKARLVGHNRHKKTALQVWRAVWAICTDSHKHRRRTGRSSHASLTVPVPSLATLAGSPSSSPCVKADPSATVRTSVTRIHLFSLLRQQCSTERACCQIKNKGTAFGWLCSRDIAVAYHFAPPRGTLSVFSASSVKRRLDLPISDN